MAADVEYERVAKYARKLTRDDPEVVRHALKRLCELPLTSAWLVRLDLIATCRNLRTCERNGKLAAYAVKKWHKLVDVVVVDVKPDVKPSFDSMFPPMIKAKIKRRAEAHPTRERDSLPKHVKTVEKAEPEKKPQLTTVDYKPVGLTAPSLIVGEKLDWSKLASASTSARMPPVNGARASTRRIAVDDTSFMRKSGHTTVFAGRRRATGPQSVKSLREVAAAYIARNLDDLECTGDIPFDILKPILTRATPVQLERIEEGNPYLLEDTDELWRAHVRGHLKLDRCDEDETWRECYHRVKHEMSTRLERISTKIGVGARDTEATLRKVAQTDVLTPKHIRRKQARNGTAIAATVSGRSLARVPDAYEVSKARRQMGAVSSSERASTSNYARREAIPSHLRSAISGTPILSEQTRHRKPVKAPMMQKTLKMLKQRR